MHNSRTRRNASHRRGQRQEITYKVLIGGWLVLHETERGTTYRVTWTVAGKLRGRTFHSQERARSFRFMLIHSTQQGQPFELESGLPLRLADQPCRRARHRQHATGGNHE